MQAQPTPTFHKYEKRTNILLVDDEPDILTLFKKSLELAGYSTYGYTNPTAALEHFRQNSRDYQVVVTDLRMPKMSGFELSREIRSINSDVKIILTSSFEITSQELHDVLPSLAIDRLIDKPVKLEKLSMVIESVVKTTRKI